MLKEKDTSTCDWQIHCKHSLSSSSVSVEKCNLSIYNSLILTYWSSFPLSGELHNPRLSPTDSSNQESTLMYDVILDIGVTKIREIFL